MSDYQRFGGLSLPPPGLSLSDASGFVMLLGLAQLAIWLPVLIVDRIFRPSKAQLAAVEPFDDSDLIAGATQGRRTPARPVSLHERLRDHARALDLNQEDPIPWWEEQDPPGHPRPEAPSPSDHRPILRPTLLPRTLETSPQDLVAPTKPSRRAIEDHGLDLTQPDRVHRPDASVLTASTRVLRPYPTGRPSPPATASGGPAPTGRPPAPPPAWETPSPAWDTPSPDWHSQEAATTRAHGTDPSRATLS